MIERWLEHYELAVGAPTAAERAAIDIVDPAELFDPTRPGSRRRRATC